MQKLRIYEAIEFAKGQGKRVRKMELAKMLWEDSSQSALKANFANLAKGRTKKVNIDAIPLLCKELGVSADFIFGLSEKPNVKDYDVAEQEARAYLSEAVKNIDKAVQTLE